MHFYDVINVFRSRRPEARPSTSLVLHLMDFEEKLRTRQKSPSLEVRSRSFLTSLDWKSQVKLAVPLSIYLMVFAFILKVLYEVFIDGSIFTDPESDEELVCF